MPNSKAKRFCNRPGCGQLVESGYCDKHKPATDERKSKLYGWQWRQVRNKFIVDNPLCVDCLAAGKVTATEEVHHILKAKLHEDRRLDPDNLMALCGDHHRIRTARGE